MSDHDREISRAFDGQAARFETAPVQSDPEALRRLVRFADLPPDSLVLDAGCGPGLVSLAFLEAGHRVYGVDLSAEMISRARARCSGHSPRARFVQGSVFDAGIEAAAGAAFDAAVSRYVLHHVTDPFGFIRRQADLLRPEGIMVLSDHTTDPDPDRAAAHQAVERLRDHTHTRNLTPGELVDLVVRAGFGDVRLAEESFRLDFDEWFDRGTPVMAKPDVRARLLGGPQARGWSAVEGADGSVRIDSVRAMVRGIGPR